MISSRTPDGYPGTCPICRNEVTVTPDEPLGDAPCPACGVLLFPIRGDRAAFLFVADELSGEFRQKLLRWTELVRDADSLGKVELVMEFEETFELNVPDEVVNNIHTLDDFLRWLWDQI
ncbi:MAG: hypothetical protein ACKVS9_14425 [Phycisphaerae bacterium]